MFSVLRSLRPRPSPPCISAARRTSRSVRAILDDDDTPVDLTEDNDAVDGIRPRPFRRAPILNPTPAAWQAHRKTLKEAFPDGWNPPRKLSREAMDGLRQLNRVDPETFTTPVLAERFRISPEAVRRILKSRWAPPQERRTKLLTREAKAKAAKLSLSGLRERLEAEKVALSREDIQAAKRVEWDLEDDDDGYGSGSVDSEPVRGIHGRDRLSFE
ncbi:hypothetical protein DFH09DRAFT_145348 [Mycena vulgaris]|nr:hypothetical protein DFH09DRAFT_145348 [Mycena vulgaris]